MTDPNGLRAALVSILERQLEECGEAFTYASSEEEAAEVLSRAFLARRKLDALRYGLGERG